MIKSSVKYWFLFKINYSISVEQDVKNLTSLVKPKNDLNKHKTQ